MKNILVFIIIAMGLAACRRSSTITPRDVKGIKTVNIDKNNVEQQHTFFNFSPYLGTQSSTRERGPITTAWLEEVSDSPYLEGVLPADRTVVYWVDTVISSLSAEDL